MTDKPIIIFGLGDFAEIALDYFTRIAHRNVIALTVHHEFMDCGKAFSRDVIPFESINNVASPQEAEIFLAIGPSKVNLIRRKIFEEIRAQGYSLPSFIHPSACVPDDMTLNENVFIFEHVCIEAFTSVGHNNIFWAGSHIAHHGSIKNHCFFAPGAHISGRVQIEDQCFLGIGSTVRDHVKLAPCTLVGAGALIKKDTKLGGVYSEKRTTLYATNSETFSI